MSEKTKVELLPHAIEQMAERGVTREQVEDTALNGEEVPAKKGRVKRSKHFSYRDWWYGTWYAGVMVITICEPTVGGVCIVVTVISKFTGKRKAA